jgi:hypothetical protein
MESSMAGMLRLLPHVSDSKQLRNVYTSVSGQLIIPGLYLSPQWQRPVPGRVVPSAPR